MRMQKKKFRIGELARQLNVERFVIRFWEKEFNIRSYRSTGGQRFFEEKDFEKFKQIKQLLYEQGFTISGAKKQLHVSKRSEVKVLASQKTMIDEPTETSEEITQQIIDLQKQLIKFRELL